MAYAPVARCTVFASQAQASQRVTMFHFDKAGDSSPASRYLYQRAIVAIRGRFEIRDAAGNVATLSEFGCVGEFDLSDPNRSFSITALTDDALLMQIAFPGVIDFPVELL